MSWWVIVLFNLLFDFWIGMNLVVRFQSNEVVKPIGIIAAARKATIAMNKFVEIFTGG